MNFQPLLAYSAAAAAGCLALAVPLRRRSTIAAWAFLLGMIVLATESGVSVLTFRDLEPARAQFWHATWLQTKALLPAVWLCFSLTYSRGNYREFFNRSRVLLAAFLLVPVALALLFRAHLFVLAPSADGTALVLRYATPAKILSGVLLIGAVLILMNLERTFRAAVGTMQWRVKFVVLGLGLVFGARIYTRSQSLIYSADTASGAAIEAGALLLGCCFIAVGYVRGGFGEIDVYPSRAALHTSITVLLTGAYLFVVGVLAQLVARTPIAGSFQLQALVILVAIAVLAVLLLSDRLRQGIGRFVSRHFKRPQHDFREIWSRFTNATGTTLEPAALSGAAARLTSETFNALSVSVWLWDRRTDKFSLGTSTFDSAAELPELTAQMPDASAIAAGLAAAVGPFDLDRSKEPWAAPLRAVSEPRFPEGGHRICVPLRTGEQLLGFMILADRVNGLPYTGEELELLGCIGDQLAASLLNLRLTEEVMVGRELQAFQTMSTFFVHDLKNAASTLTLMLQNLPVHFHDPAFREDALRGIGRTAERINQMITSLSVVREKLAVNPVDFDLNQALEEALEHLNGVPSLQVLRELQPLPKVRADRGQLQSVITNLLLNARDAVAEKGTVRVQTARSDGWATLAVSDDGCGMSAVFLRESLFRPFCTTKKKGLGIGMFQSKMIVEAHGGRIQVTSDVGKGTTFRIFLPLSPAVK